MNKPLNTLYCSECGSSSVEIRMWVNPNTNTIGTACSDISEEADNRCSNCEKHAELLTLQELWDKFSDITINSDDEIESKFMQFEATTPRLDVWHWFDERCPNNLHDDLLYPEVKKLISKSKGKTLIEIY